MTDVLIRDLKPQDVARLDAHAAALGLSRSICVDGSSRRPAVERAR